MIVPPVPTPATNTSTSPSVSFQISGPVVFLWAAGFAGFSNCSGMKLSAITAVPDSPDGYDLVFTVSEEGICGFLSYLLLEYDDITVTGFAGMI